MKDLINLRDWLQARGLPPEYTDDLPSVGFSVFEENEMIAAGFIRLCEGSHGLVDGLITNPATPSELRDKALDLLINHITLVAKKMHLKSLIGHCADKNTILRAERHSFQPLPHVLLALNLTKVG